MPNSRSNGPENTKDQAIKTIEKLANSPEHGETLVRQINDAHKILESSMKEANSPEEELPLRLALQDIQSLESVLAERGKKRKLTDSEKATLSSVAEDLKSKVDNLDIVLDVVKFSQNFYKNLAERNRSVKSLNGEISEENTSPQFLIISKSVLRNSETLKADYYSYYENLVLQFGIDGIPKEIEAEFDKMQMELVKLEKNDELVKNSIEFATLEQKFSELNSNTGAENFINLQKKIESLQNKGLISGLNNLAKKVVTSLEWNLNLREKADASQPKKILEVLKASESLISAGNYSMEFDRILSILLSDVVYASNKENLPKDSVFYKELYSLLSRRLERSDSSEFESTGRVMLSQIAVLAANTEHAALYTPGIEILVYDKSKPSVQDPSSDLPAGNSDEFSAARGSWRDTDKYRHFGTIRASDPWKGTVEFDDRGDLFNFTHFENSDQFEYAFKKVGSDGEVITVDDKLKKSEVSSFTKRAENDMRQGELFILKSSIESLNKDIKISDTHIPKISLLRKFQEENWVSIGKDGIVKINCPDENIETVYNELMKQFNLEKLYAEASDITNIERTFPEKVKEDHFFAARKIFNQAKIEMVSGQTYEARGSLVKFLDSMALVKDTRDDDMKGAEDFALETLRNFSIVSLQRVDSNADQLFGHNEKYKEFLSILHSMIKAETTKLEAGKDYRIDISNLRLGHWRYDAAKGTLPNFASYDMTGLVGLQILNYDAAEKFADKEVGEIRSNKDLKNWNDALIEYFEGMYPPVVEIETWNRIVSIENPKNFVELSDSTTRKARFSSFADFVRDGHGRKVPRPIINAKGENDRRWEQEGGEIHPELAVSYYRDALGDETKDAEFDLMNVRNRFIKMEKSEKKDLYLSQAKLEIEKELNSARLKSSFLGTLNISANDISDADFNDLKANLLTPEVLDAMAEELLNRSVDEKMKMQVYKRFYDGKNLSGAAKEIWSKINDIEDPFNETWNWSDRTSQHIKEELVINALIAAASFGVAELVTGGMRAVYLAARGLKAAGTIDSATAGYRIANLGAKAMNFTLADKSIRSAFFHQNTWGTFGGDLSLNLAMFVGIGAGMHFWEKTLGKELVGAAEGAKIFETRTNLKFVESPLFQRAGSIGARKTGGDIGKESWAQLGLRGANWAGKLSTETALFTGMGVGQKLSVGKMKWENINMTEELGMNLLTILSMRAGNMVFEPVTRPLMGRVEVKARRMLEDADHSRFLENHGLEKSFFGNTDTKTQQGIINELRIFSDKYDLSPSFFSGKNLENIRKTSKAVTDFVSKCERNGMFELPSREDFMSLYKTNTEAFEIIAEKLNNWPLRLDDAREIYAKNPELMVKFAGRVEGFRKWLISSIKEQAKSDRRKAREMESGLDENGEVVIDGLMQKLTGSPEDFAQGLEAIGDIGHLTLSTNQLLWVTSKLPSNWARELFIKTCTRRMAESQKLQFEEATEKPDDWFSAFERPGSRVDSESNEPTTLQVLRDFDQGFGRWMLNTMRAAALAAAIHTGAMEFGAKPEKAVASLVEGADIASLPRATENSRSLLFSMDNPGEVKDASTALKSDWKTKSQNQICSEMAEQGLPNDVINDAKVAHSEIPVELQKFVRVFVEQEKGKSPEPFFAVDKEGIQSELGLNPEETAKLLKDSGVLMPETLQELADQMQMPRDVMASMVGVNESKLGEMKLMKAGIGDGIFALSKWMLSTTWGLISLAGGGIGFLIRRRLADRRTKKLIEESKDPNSGSGKAPALTKREAKNFEFRTPKDILGNEDFASLSGPEKANFDARVQTLRELYGSANSFTPDQAKELFEISVKIVCVETLMRSGNTLTSDNSAEIARIISRQATGDKSFDPKSIDDLKAERDRLLGSNSVGGLDSKIASLSAITKKNAAQTAELENLNKAKVLEDAIHQIDGLSKNSSSRDLDTELDGLWASWINTLQNVEVASAKESTDKTGRSLKTLGLRRNVLQAEKVLGKQTPAPEPAEMKNLVKILRSNEVAELPSNINKLKTLELAYLTFEIRLRKINGKRGTGTYDKTTDVDRVSDDKFIQAHSEVKAERDALKAKVDNVWNKVKGLNTPSGKKIVIWGIILALAAATAVIHFTKDKKKETAAAGSLEDNKKKQTQEEAKEAIKVTDELAPLSEPEAEKIEIPEETNGGDNEKATEQTTTENNETMKAPEQPVESETGNGVDVPKFDAKQKYRDEFKARVKAEIERQAKEEKKNP